MRRIGALVLWLSVMLAHSLPAISAERGNPFLKLDPNRTQVEAAEQIALGNLYRAYDLPSYFWLLRQAGADVEEWHDVRAYLLGLEVELCSAKRFAHGLYEAMGTRGYAVLMRDPKEGEQCLFDSKTKFYMSLECGNPAVREQSSAAIDANQVGRIVVPSNMITGTCLNDCAIGGAVQNQ